MEKNLKGVMAFSDSAIKSGAAMAITFGGPLAILSMGAPSTPSLKAMFAIAVAVTAVTGMLTGTAVFHEHETRKKQTYSDCHKFGLIAGTLSSLTLVLGLMIANSPTHEPPETAIVEPAAYLQLPGGGPEAPRAAP